MADDRTAMVNWVKKALSAFQNRPLTDAQCSLIDQFLQGKTIENAAKDSGYSVIHAKRVSADIGEAIALEMGESKRINKSSWLPKIRDYLRQQPESDFAAGEGPIAHPSVPNQNFVGREGAIASLNTHINQGAKIIVIQATGGVGKTTLAHEYLNSQGFDLVLDLPMAKEKDNIQLVDSVIEGWLKQDFDEEPGREFWEILRRLKRQLQTRKIGVLIDNLEPALDGQGRFIEPHRRYVELLRVLADPTVLSVTLITSRVRMCEPDVNVDRYLLPGLNEQAWQQFFMNRHINIDISTLNAMHKAYAGNAKAMGILCGAILEDFDGDIVAYWRNNSGDLLVKADLENLVTSQFDRLQELNSEAYRLLYRLGCYRYQDVPTVPTEGLFCLLWDVPEGQRRRVIESLRNRSLVEFNKGEYWLHPMIREEAIARLRASEDWEEANRKAAEFWTESVEIVETVQQALIAVEAYYHYIEIENFELAAEILLKPRDNKLREGELLGISFYRLGLLKQMISAIGKIINYIQPSYSLSRIYNILGDLYWLTGSIDRAIQSHKISKNIAIDFNIIGLNIVSYFNIGLCKLELGEIEDAISYFESANLLAENNSYHRHTVGSWFCLAFCYSCLGVPSKALEFTEKVKESEEFKIKLLNSWATGYSLLFMGLTYKNLGEPAKSFEMFRQAIAFAEKTHYTQVKAKALSGLAELYREQSDFTTALSHHSESIALLEKIGAKCDLAEAHYQRALTYQKMGDAEKSQTPFQEAIRLFNAMEAPNQVEKVRKARGKSDEVEF
ncbi:MULTISPECIES: tetratricopeptide repeat protein [unclassified Microcoleus]|uniref:tetratricopeptide repeat protein n=1 Tax=unclassified Microcoleus TaxID=2642155 RepID=UPI0025E34FCB|nr:MULTISPECIES: tetratricopeptide repeat protein [unclassified Microcoleus]